MLTWGIIDKMEAGLKRAHDAARVQPVIHFVHCEPIPVLNGTVAKGKAEDPSKLYRVDGDDDFRYYYGVELA